MDLKKHIRKIISEEIDTGSNDIYNNLYFKRRILREELNKPKKDYTNVIESLINPFKDEVGVCDITVLYDKYDDIYSVYLIFSTKETDSMYDENRYGKRDGYMRELRHKVKNEIKSYLPIHNIYVGANTQYECD